MRPITSLVDDDSATLQILPDVLRIQLRVAVDVSSSRANALHRLATGSDHALRALERDTETARR